LRNRSLVEIAIVAVLALAAQASCSLPDRPRPPSGDDVIAPPPDADPFQAPDNRVPGEANAPGFFVGAVTPGRGPIAGGTRVEVTGAGFLPGSTVVFEGSEGVETVVANDGSLSTTTPPHPAGMVPVTVTRPDGKFARIDDAFLYEAEVTIDSVEPATGPSRGGTPVTVRGRGFGAGTALVIGGRLAISPHVIDPATVIALTPPGDPGPRDVMAVGPWGSAVLKKGFKYVAPPVASGCTPPAVFANAETELEVAGSGLAGAWSVVATAGEATVLSSSDGSVRFRLAAGAPGPIGITVATPGGVVAVPSCLVAIDPADLLDPLPSVLGIVPGIGAATGGDVVRVIASALPAAAADAGISFGGTPAEVLDVVGGVLHVRTPPHAPGRVDVALVVPAGHAVAPEAFEYVPAVTLSGITPPSGPASGGTVVTLTGSGLDRVREVRVGPLPALILPGTTQGAVRVETAPGSPGVHDVVATTDWGRTVVLPRAFTYGGTDRGLVAVTPNAGAIAGGTLVTLVGSGFRSDVWVLFGDRPALIEDAADPARLLVRTPPGTPGPVDVEVRWPGNTTARLPHAYTYFDPTGYFGGIWGDVIDQAVNVTVLNSWNSEPVFDAFVVLGSDTDTPWRGRTDLNGQVTLSGPDLFGPLQVTATRFDHSTFTYAGVDSENVTIFIDGVIPSTGGGGTGARPLPPGTVTGRVVGVDKYLLAPPASCADRPLVHGKLCAPCAADADCGEAARCLDPAGMGRACATGCESEADCPVGYDCYGISMAGSACLPSIGRGEVRCGVAWPGMYSDGEDPGQGAVADEQHRFALNSRLGDVAVWCVGGVRRFDDGGFEPLALGLLRHVSVYPAHVTADREVRLDIPLDRDLEVRFLNAPGGPGGANRHAVRVAIDLGSDGVLSLWPIVAGVDRERFVVPRFPRTFDGPLADAIVRIDGDAASATDDTTPYSSSIVREWRPGSGNLVLRVDPAVAAAIDPSVRPDAIAGCGLPGGGGIVVGAGGRTWAVDPEGAVSLAPSLASGTLRACAVAPDGTVWAVGDHGLAVHAAGPAVLREIAPTSATLRAVSTAADGTVWAAGDGVILRRAPDGTWTRIDPGIPAPLHGIAAAPDGLRAVAVGAGGVAVKVVGATASPVTPWPASRDLLAVASAASGDWFVAVGARGTAVRGTFDGGFVPLPGVPASPAAAPGVPAPGVPAPGAPPPPDADPGDPAPGVPASAGTPPPADLRAVMRLDDGSTFLAAGAAGTIVRLPADRTWTPVPAPGFSGEITTLLPGAAPGKGAAATSLALSSDTVAVGPFLDVPRFSSPPEVLPWTGRTVAWSRTYAPQPSLTFTRLSGTKGAMPWVVVGRGDLQSFTLPDLLAMPDSGLPSDPLPTGDVRVYATHALIDDFDYRAFDETAQYMSSWRSWTVDQIRAKR